MSMENIEHVVLLMLENRSFDSLLGWLYEHDAPALNIPPAAPGDLFRGLQSVDLDKFINTALNGTLSAKPTRGVQGFTVPDVDPGEEFAHVNTQFYGTSTPAPGIPITMTGVLADFVEVLQERKYSDADIRRLAKMSLESFTPGQLPVLNQLAKHYAVSDDWFASVPSQTNPNRAFLMCGTSNGMVNNGDLEDHNANPQAVGLEKVLGMMIGDDRVDAPTIFNALNDAGIDWTVFWQTSYLPHKIATLLTGLPLLIPLLAEAPALAAVFLALLTPFAVYLKELSSGDLTSCYTWRLFPQIQGKIPNAAQHFQKLEAFHRLARSGQLPKFSYIEPFWSISHNSNPKLEQLISALGNDYHPPCNILVGEEFVKEVYTSLIANREAWCKTLLIITFDEFVGAFDHVTDPLKPGVVTPPWGPNGQPPFKSPTKFKFDRLGARIPTILVSPYVQKGTVFRSTTSIPYDHTSIIATTLKWLGQSSRISAFGERTQAAPTFEQALTLNLPRADEKDLRFLDTPRYIGDPVRYGDSFVLKNQNGKYLSTFYCTMKAGGGGSVIPDSVLGICVDLGIAAYFPRLGGDQKAVLSFVTQAPDPAAQINHNSQVMLVSRESGLSALNILGAWADSHDCYYADEYLDGDDATKEKWILQKLDNTDQPLRYGDQIYLVNSFYKDKRLMHDTRPFQSEWITTGSDGDYWIVEPAEARVHNVGRVLFYYAYAGEGKTALIDGAGMFHYASYSGFNRGWTHIVGVGNGSLLSYNADSGLGEIAVLDAAGKYHYVSNPSLDTGWTHIIGAGNGSLLFYNANTGHGATATIDAAGNYHYIGRTPDFTRGWTLIVGAGNGSLLFYNANTGHGATAILDAAGNYHYIGGTPDFTRGWTHIVGAGDGSLLFYNADSGSLATAILDAAGKYHYVGRSPFSDLSRWTHIVGVGNGLLLFYDAVTGGVSTASAGKYQNVGSNRGVWPGILWTERAGWDIVAAL